MNSSSFKVLNCKYTSVYCEDCRSSQDFCRYRFIYAEGSSISGYLIQDLVIFGDDLNHSHSVSFVFECQMKETFLFCSQLADGIIGLP